MSKVTIEVDAAIEINNPADFNLWATLFGIDVPATGRKPFAKLAKAIKDHEVHYVVDTKYFQAAMADGTGAAGTEYGTRKRMLLDAREDAVAAAHATYDAALAELRAEFNVATTPAAKATTGGKTTGYQVTAKTPVLDRTDPDKVTVKRTKPVGDKPGKVRFGPAKTVEVSLAEVREISETEGARGRPSKSNTVHAAAVKGGWLPTELMTVEGWESVLLADIDVTTVVAAAEAS